MNDLADVAANEIAELKIIGGELLAVTNNANSGAIQINIPNDWDFIIDSWHTAAVLNAAGGGAVAGAALVEDPSPTLASNTMYSAYNVNVGINIKGDNIIDTPQPIPLVCGKARDSSAWLVGRRIPAGTAIRIPIENYAGVTIDVLTTFIGRKVTRRAK